MVKEDLIKVFQELLSIGKIEKSLNAICIALIPKQIKASAVRDYRPINLVNGIYKIIFKVLTNRLREVGKIITKSQNAFVWSKPILNSTLIANKCLDSRVKFGIPCILCKLDMKKTYDQVN